MTKLKLYTNTSNRTNIIGISIVLFLIFFCRMVKAQPIDLMLPSGNSPDNLSKELRGLQALERDMAIEKLSKEPSKLDAYLELADLRLSQGKLLEAQRFYEMALKLDPNNLRANQGLTMVYYEKGEFSKAKQTFEKLNKFHPISDQLQYQLTNLKSEISQEIQAGLTIRENNKGLLQVTGSAEYFVPSFTYKKLKARYRFENHDYKEGNFKTNSRVYQTTLDYTFDNNNSFSVTYAPESFSGNNTLNGYGILLITGTDNLHLAVNKAQETFRDNIYTINNHLSLKSNQLTLFGELHKRTKISQTVTQTDISDGNFFQRYDSQILYAIYRRGAPFLTLNLNISQTSYDKQTDSFGNPYNYWCPSKFQGTELTLSWERSVGVHWWWGIDANISNNNYKLNDDTTYYEKGGGYQVHFSYNFSKGRLFASFADRINDYLRERRLNVYTSINF